MKDPHTVIVKPHITERTASFSYGDPRIREEKDLVRKYTFIVARDATKIEIKAAIEAIYNAGKKKGERIEVQKVNTITMHGKTRRVRARHSQFPIQGKRPDTKKAIVTLLPGQQLEDYGV